MSQTTASAETATAPETTESPSPSALRPLTPEDLYALRLVEDPRISPDGALVAYVQQEMDRASYEYRRSIWLMSYRAPTACAGAHVRSLPRPRWSITAPFRGPMTFAQPLCRICKPARRRGHHDLAFHDVLRSGR